jgi:aldehyde dehydrogenase (NAD+)
VTETLRLTHAIADRRVVGPDAFEQRSPGDPADLAVTGPEAGADVVAESVAAARTAQARLRDGGIEAISDALDRIADRIAEAAPVLALLAARETGKTVRDARAEALRAARIFRFFAGETLRNAGERFDSTRRGVTVEVTHEPVGVIGAITPWNFPLAIPAWKIAPALAFGNAVVWKPSELSSATADALLTIINDAGLPEGAVNMLLGAGGAGASIAGCQGIDAVSFTGSQAVGRAVRLAGAERGAGVQLEMGGVNGLIVLADADIDAAVEAAVNGAFFAAGQRCTATSRLIVEAPVADTFVERLSARTASLRIGDPREDSTDVGPLASMRQKARLEEAVARVETSGAVRLFGAASSSLPHCFVAPTLFEGADRDGPLAQEEIFGPVAGLFRVADFDEAMAVLNATPFGLSAGLCTRSLAKAEAFKRQARAGMCMVNLPTAGVDHHAPFGGVGASSYGPREQGRAARGFYTRMKTVYQA